MNVAPYSNYPVWLLDLNGTFMFGGDRFGPDQDYGATYAQLGGTLAPAHAHTLLAECFAYLAERYPQPAYHNAFPTVSATLRHLTRDTPLPETEIALLSHVFAQHEVGQIPSAYASAITTFAQSHRLALIADIWAEKSLWLAELKRAGVLKAFEAVLFSSDYGIVKPSPRLFEIALHHMAVAPSDCIMIGDSARRDVGGAAAAGISSIWIGTGTSPPQAQAMIPNLLALLS